MRHEILGIGVLLALTVHPALAETTTGDVSKKTSEAWDTVKSYTVEKKNEAVAYGRKLVRQTDRELHQLERKASTASDEAKAGLQSDMKELKARRKEASKKLDEMGRATSAAWEEARNGFAEAYKDLHQAYDKAVAKLK